MRYKWILPNMGFYETHFIIHDLKIIKGRKAYVWYGKTGYVWTITENLWLW